jgi:ribonuclease PH
MLPAATGERRNRNRQSIDGRTQEIQRLIGRALRSVVDLKKLGENTILVDCDVIQADGGTRTAAITGAYVAVVDAVRHAIRQKTIGQPPFVDSVAAVSVGIVGGRVVADLNYAEDSSADVDLNLVMTGGGTFVEIQGTAERGTFTQQMLDRMLRTGSRAVRELLEVQTRALKRKG